MYQEKRTDENVNMRQEEKFIILKAILKRPKLETIREVEDKEADINLRRGSDSY